MNIVTRRVETDNNVLLQVRDESSFHGLMLLAIQFGLIRNVLEFLFQNLKSGNQQLFRDTAFCRELGVMGGRLQNISVVQSWARVHRSATITVSVQLCFASCR